MYIAQMYIVHTHTHIYIYIHRYLHVTHTHYIYIYITRKHIIIYIYNIYTHTYIYTYLTHAHRYRNVDTRNRLYGTGAAQPSSVLQAKAHVQITEDPVAKSWFWTKAIQKEMDKHPGSISTSWRIGWCCAA
jgi:hypothetical protein